jgi:anti-anti-sigma factor
VDERPPWSVAETLLHYGVDVAQTLKESQLALATSAESYLATGAFDPDTCIAQWKEIAKRAVADGYSGLRVAGDMGWVARGVAGCERIVEYEWRLQDEVFAAAPVAGMCEFDMRRFPPSALEWIHNVHPDGEVQPDPLWRTDGASLTPLFSRPGAILAGEIDAYTRPGLKEALEQLCEQSEREDVALDLSQAVYMDVAALRMLVDIAARIQPKRMLIFVGVPDHVREMLDVLDWSSAPGIRLE